MLDNIVSFLSGSDIFSIFVGAVVAVMIFLAIVVIYRKAREEKRVEQLRWRKVSANMALYDTQERVVIPLEADEILVGRHGAADIRFSDMSVSRYHAVLRVSNGVWQVMDLDSKTGTYVNGKQIHTVHKLSAMDEIRFGDKRVILRERKEGRHV